jgi:hypothetical protein
VDFVIPKQVNSGDPRVEITCRGVTGPVERIPLR